MTPAARQLVIRGLYYSLVLVSVAGLLFIWSLAQ
jgi:hypothetical protein